MAISPIFFILISIVDFFMTEVFLTHHQEIKIIDKGYIRTLNDPRSLAIEGSFYRIFLLRAIYLFKLLLFLKEKKFSTSAMGCLFANFIFNCFMVDYPELFDRQEELNQHKQLMWKLYIINCWVLTIFVLFLPYFK